MLTTIFNKFFNSEKSGGIVLLLATIISLIIANSAVGLDYVGFWNTYIGGHSLVHWINDGLMAIFFLLIGLELEREVYQGELSKPRDAAFPLFGAIGGMLIPATIFFLFNYGKESISGIGIPMATDIAFAIGILALLGKRVPASLKVFLVAFAIMDDLGAILIIAIFYTSSLSFLYLGIALAIFGFLLVLNRFKIYSIIPYIIGGILMWYFMLNSGVHATISGVLLAFAIPFKRNTQNCPSHKLEHFLHKPVAFMILPLFALANTCIIFPDTWINGLSSPLSIGIMAGLLLGKPLGIFLFSGLGVILKLCKMPSGIKWSNIIGIGFLGAIGFTMSIFISILAFDILIMVDTAKIAILFSSLLAGIIGLSLLRISLRKNIKEPEV